MPFVTVVTLGAASAASDMISSVVSPTGKEDDDGGENKSKLMKIRELGENEQVDDFPVMDRNNGAKGATKPSSKSHNKLNINLNKKGKCNIGGGSGSSKKCSEKIFSRASSKGTVSSSSLSLSFSFGNLAQSKRKSVSFVDLRSAGKMVSSTSNNKANKNKNKLLALIDLSPTSVVSNGSSAESGYDGSGDDSGSCRSSTSSRSSSSSSCSPPVAHLLLEEEEGEEDDDDIVVEEDEEDEEESVGFGRGARRNARSHTDLTMVGRHGSCSDLLESTRATSSTSANQQNNKSNNITTTSIVSSNCSAATISGIIPTDDTGPSAVSSIRFIPCHEDDYVPQVIEVNKPLTLNSGGGVSNSLCYTSTVNISASTNNLSSGFSSLLNTPSPSIASFASAQLISSSGGIGQSNLHYNHHSHVPSSIATSSSQAPTSLLSSHIPKLSGTVQGRTNIWKTWIRNKLNLNRNGKYSLEGSMASLGPFNVKAVIKIN